MPIVLERITSEYLATVINFYRWVMNAHVLVPDYPPFQHRSARVTYEDHFGFVRTMTVASSDLRISNKTSRGPKLENGLRPVSDDVRRKIIEVATEQCPGTTIYCANRFVMRSGVTCPNRAIEHELTAQGKDVRAKTVLESPIMNW